MKSFKRINTSQNIKLLIVVSHWYSNLKLDNYMREIKKELEEIEDKVIFTGFVRPEDMPKIYKTMDILVVPTMNEEPFGCVVIEGMALGKPLIVTKSGAFPEIIKKDFCFMIDKDENLIYNMAIAIKILAENDILRKKYGENARKEFEQNKNYHKEQYYKNFIKIINTVNTEE